MIPAGFASEWEASWNAQDLPQILSHYTDDVRFRSRKAIAVSGDGLIVGKSALAAYWGSALASQPDLKFTVEEVFTGYDMLAIAYRNHKGVAAVETLYFEDTGLIYRAAACHA